MNNQNYFFKLHFKTNHMKRKLIYAVLILSLVVATSFIYKNHLSKANESKDENSFAWSYAGNFTSNGTVIYVWVDANNSSVVVKCSFIRAPVHTSDFSTASGTSGVLSVTNFVGCGVTSPYTGPLSY